jgi:hypothetical protein
MVLEKKYDVRALFVGIDRYQDARLNQEAPLQFASNDAVEMTATVACSDTLRQSKYFYTYTNKDATRQALRAALSNVFPSNLTFDSQSLALFFFSGHGLKDPHSDKIYLACFDVDMADPATGGISLNEIHDYLHNSSAGNSIIIIDACFSGGLTDPTRFEYITPVELARRSLGTLYGSDDKNGGIFMSCRSSQKSHEDEEKQHGIYTYEILRGWRDAEARNANGVVTLTSLRGYLEDSFAHYREQTPKANLFGNRPIELWYAQPRTPGATVQRDMSLPLPPSLTEVGGRNVMPVALLEVRGKISKQPAKDLRECLEASGRLVKARPIPILVIALALFACVLSPFVIPQLQLILLVAVFVLGLLLPLGSFLVNRVLGFVLTFVQIFLLVGFASRYFGWGDSVSVLKAPLTFLKDLEWVFWLLFIGEMAIALLVTLDAMMG